MKTSTSRFGSREQKLAWERELHVRVKQAVDGISFSRLASLTGVHPETVRRYITRGRPSAYFVAALCQGLGLSPEWLLQGGTANKPKSGRSTIELKPDGAATNATARTI